MESHLVRIINRLEMMAADGGNSKRNFEREGVVVAEVSFSNDPENGPVYILRDVEARESYSFVSVYACFNCKKKWSHFKSFRRVFDCYVNHYFFIPKYRIYKKNTLLLYSLLI